MNKIINLFKRKKYDNNMVIKKWADEMDSKLKKADELTFGVTFAFIIWFLTDIWFFDKKIHNQIDIYNDKAIFEVGAYMMVRIDLYMYNSYSEHREEFVGNLFNVYLGLLNKAFNADLKIENIFDSRIELYGQMYREKKGVEEIHDVLSEFILEKNFDSKSPNILPSLVKQLIIKNKLITVEKYLFTEAINLIDKYIVKISL